MPSPTYKPPPYGYSEGAYTCRCPNCAYIGWPNWHDTEGPLCPRCKGWPGHYVLMEQIHIDRLTVVAGGEEMRDHKG